MLCPFPLFRCYGLRKSPSRRRRASRHRLPAAQRRYGRLAAATAASSSAFCISTRVCPRVTHTVGDTLVAHTQPTHSGRHQHPPHEATSPPAPLISAPRALPRSRRARPTERLRDPDARHARPLRLTPPLQAASRQGRSLRLSPPPPHSRRTSPTTASPSGSPRRPSAPSDPRSAPPSPARARPPARSWPPVR
jgi:hypothetical protein